MWIQKEIVLHKRPRGFYLITNELLRDLPEIQTVKIGLLNLFIKHTSASLTLNENASSEVQTDLEEYFNRLVPDGLPYFEHNYEGDDDMAAHVKSTLTNSSLTLPIANGKLNIGIWQGIYLLEHRNNGGTRKIIATINGENL